MPEVSFVVIAYNLQPFIGACLTSLRSVTDLSAEVIVVDDGSIDGSDLEAESLLQGGAWPGRLIRQPNQGPGAARNAGLTHAQGRWVFFLDGDDVLEPVAFAYMLSVAREHPQATVVGGFRYWFPGEAPGAVQGRLVGIDGGVTCWAAEIGLLRFLDEGYFACWGMLIPRQPLLAWLGGSELFPPRVIHEDVPATLRIMLAAQGMVGVPEGVVLYRQRAASITHGATRRRLFEIPVAYSQAMHSLQRAGAGGEAMRRLTIRFADELIVGVREVRKMPQPEARDILTRTRATLRSTGWLGFWRAPGIRAKDRLDMLLLFSSVRLFCKIKLRGPTA